MPGGVQDRLRPQSDLLIAGLSRKAGTLVDQAIADAQSARRRFHQQQPKPRDFLGFANQKNGTDYAAVFLGHPAALALGIELLDKLCGDLRYYPLEALVPSIILRVQRPMAMNNPAHVPRLVRPQKIRR